MAVALFLAPVFIMIAMMAGSALVAVGFGHSEEGLGLEGLEFAGYTLQTRSVVSPSPLMGGGLGGEGEEYQRC